jgi:predicted HD phosphohydrolase
MLIATIERLFVEHGASVYEGARRESVSALEHALQCAQLAEWAHADAPLVAAALLHDMGTSSWPTRTPTTCTNCAPFRSWLIRWPCKAGR